MNYFLWPNILIDFQHKPTWEHWYTQQEESCHRERLDSVLASTLFMKYTLSIMSSFSCWSQCDQALMVTNRHIWSHWLVLKKQKVKSHFWIFFHYHKIDRKLCLNKKLNWFLYVIIFQELRQMLKFSKINHSFTKGLKKLSFSLFWIWNGKQR